MDKDKLEYHRNYNITRYHKIFNELLKEQGGKCVLCSSTEKLHFDHIDPSTMEFRISTGITTKSMAAVREELKKCQVLCERCHINKTVREKGQLRLGVHGTLNMATHGKCKCDECRSAKNKYMREWKRENRRKNNLR